MSRSLDVQTTYHDLNRIQAARFAPDVSSRAHPCPTRAQPRSRSWHAFAGCHRGGEFIRAGARSALATLWSVNDEASATLVTRFYRELASGASRATALQRAQQELLAENVTRHPAYWSPFLLISRWL
jgi:hypothetical protein